MTSCFLHLSWRRLGAIVAALFASLTSQGAIRTAIGGLYTPSGAGAATMGMTMGDYTWTPMTSPTILNTLYLNLDEGADYDFAVNASNVTNHTVVISPPSGYVAYIDGIERSAYQIDGPVTGSATRHLTVHVVKRWDANLGFKDFAAGPSGGTLGESGSMSIGQPNDGSDYDYRPHLSFGMGHARNGAPLSLMTEFAAINGTYAGPDVVVSRTGTGSSMITTIDAPEVTVIVSAGQGSAPDPGGTTRTIKFCPPGTSAPFLTYQFQSWSTDHWRTVVTKNYAGSGRQYQMQITYGVPDANQGPGQENFTLEDWHETAPTNPGVARYVRLSRTFSAPRVTDVITVAPSSDFSTPAAVTTNIYRREAASSWSLLGEYRNYIYRLESSTQNGAQNYVTTTIDPLNPSAHGFTLPGGGTEITELGAINNLPAKTYRTWLDQSPTKADGQPVVPNDSLIESILYMTDWSGAQVLPTSIRRVAGSSGTLIAEATLVHGQEGTGPINGAIVQTVARYDFVASGTTGSATTPRSATDGDALKTVTKFYRADATDQILAKLPYAVENPDGTKRSFAYERGTYNLDTYAFTTSSSGNDLRITCFYGVTPTGSAPANLTSYNGLTVDGVRLVAEKSIKRVQVLHLGRLVRNESYLYNISSAFEITPASWENFAYNDAGRLIARQGSDNTSLTSEWADVGRKSTETDHTGTVTTFGYDAMDRLASVARPAAGEAAPLGGTQVPAQFTAFEYDAAQQVRFVRQGPVGGERLVTENIYDTAGRVTSTITAGITTAFIYPNGGRDIQTTYAAGTAEAATQLITRFVDGRVASIAGSAVTPEYHKYEFLNGQLVHTTRLADNNFTNNSGRIQKTSYDLLGRVVEERANGFGASGSSKPLVTSRTYDPARGLLSKISTKEAGAVPLSLGADQRFEYDEFGRLSAAGIDLNSTPTLDASSTDRFTAFDTRFVNENGAWWLRTQRTVYHTDNSDASYQSTSKTRLGAMPAGTLGQSITTDFYGNTTTETVLYNTTAKSHVLVSALPSGASFERTSIGGFTTAEKWFDAADPSRASAPALATTYAYDAQGRAVSATDSRLGTSRTSYYYGTTRPYQVYDARNVLVVTHAYSAGRLVSSTDPAGVSCFAYNLRGQLIRQWGSSGHPVEYEYNDTFGERTKMRTFRDTSADFTSATWPYGGYPSSTGDATTWDYDVNTGWLVAKSDATSTIGAPRMVTYDYANTASDRQVTRTWARNSGGVSTTYHYSRTTGDLTLIDYSDTTPDVSYTYARTGQAKSVTDVTGTRQFYYANGQLSAEYPDATWFNGLVLTPQYQTTTDPAVNSVAGRAAGFFLGKDGDRDPAVNNPDLDQEMAVAYGYDALGRVNAVNASYRAQTSRAALSVPGSYRYKPQSPLWDKLTQGNYSYERVLEANRDIILTLTAAHTTAGTLATFGYNTDDIGRRTWATQAGMSYDDVLPATYYRYSYSPTASAELTSATGYRGSDTASTSNPLPGRGFGYNYDHAGNRKSASVGSDTANYRSGPSAGDPAGGNSLNQPRSRDTLKTHVSGTAHPEATVTAGGAATTRENPVDRYWDFAIPGYGQNTTLAITATRPGYTAQNTSVVALTRPATEVLNYDEDGNLKEDSQWVYEWDAENRLKRMYTNPAFSWGAPDRELLFTYDYLGRRIRKIAKDNGVTTSDRKYLYDGWDLIAELDPATGKITRSYVWGLDPSGGLDGTNAAGALILETVHTDTTLTACHVIADGTGNVTALVKQATGAIGAVYEYGPFGEQVRVETFDAALAGQPFRFSTKFTDQETGLVYYGHRYYDRSMGRFISRDPIEEAGGNNLYGFVGNSPINGVDRLGLIPDWLKRLLGSDTKPTASDDDQGSGAGSVFTPIETGGRRDFGDVDSSPDAYDPGIAYNPGPRDLRLKQGGNGGFAPDRGGPFGTPTGTIMVMDSEGMMVPSIDWGRDAPRIEYGKRHPIDSVVVLGTSATLRLLSSEQNGSAAGVSVVIDDYLNARGLSGDDGLRRLAGVGMAAGEVVEAVGTAREAMNPGGGKQPSAQARRKPVNLPSAKGLNVDIDHIASGHMVGGNRVSPNKDLFPPNWSRAQVETAVRDAYSNGKRVETQGTDRVRVQGQSGGRTIEMWVNTKTKTIETAYPIN